MPSDSNSDFKLEIGHVLFIDIVGYSKLLINGISKLFESSTFTKSARAQRNARNEAPDFNIFGARRFERYLKTGSGREFLADTFKNSRVVIPRLRDEGGQFIFDLRFAICDCRFK